MNACLRAPVQWRAIGNAGRTHCEGADVLSLRKLSPRITRGDMHEPRSLPHY